MQLITAQGVPMLEGPEGPLVELALALVRNGRWPGLSKGPRWPAEPGTAQGVASQLVEPLRMKWQDQRLVPDDSYPVVCDIWRMALEGETLRSIAKKLTQRGIPTPREDGSGALPL